MKKLTALILAGVFAASAVLSSCSDKKAEETPASPETEGVENENTQDSADVGETPDEGAEVEPEVENEPTSEEEPATEENVVEELSVLDIQPFPTDSVFAYHTHFEDNLVKVIEKTDLDNETLITIEGVPVSAAFVRYAVISSNLYFDGTQEEKDEEIDRFLRVNAYLVNEAFKNGITISNEDFHTYFTENYDMMKMYYGEDVASIIEMYMFQTPFAYYMNTFYNLLYSQLSPLLLEDEDFAAKVKDATLANLAESETPYVRAKHILICFPEEGAGEDGAVTDEQKAEILAKANDVVALIEQGEDFDALVAEYGEDPGMEAYPGGYYFTTGEMVEPFEQTAFALEEGEVSEPVETTFGYHIILRLPLDDDEAIKGASMYQSTASEMLLDRFSELSADYEFVYSDNYEDRYADFYEEAVALATPVEEETSEDAAAAEEDTAVEAE